jgi:hypothetical protein
VRISLYRFFQLSFANSLAITHREYDIDADTNSNSIAD